MSENKSISLRSLSIMQWNAGIGMLGIALGLYFYFPQGPDETRSLSAFVGLIGFFLAYFCSQISWGLVFCKLFRQKVTIWESAFWGSLFFALGIGTFGFLPILGESARMFWVIFFLTGLALSFYLARTEEEESADRFHWSDFVVSFYLLISVIGALSPHSFWDSLWYHLTSSRLWYENGRIYLPENFPIALKAGFWDYHFVLGQILLGSAKNAGGLIAAHIFGQLAALATVFFSFLTIRKGLRPFGFSPFMALFAIVGTELFLEVEFAKNDWASVFWTLVAITFALQGRSFVWVALVAGFSFAAKFTCAFFFAPFLLYLAWKNRQDPKIVAWGGIAFVAATLPLLGRNLWLTGNPFFPALHHHFPTALLGPSWENIKAFSGNTSGLPYLTDKILFLFRDSKAVIFLLLLPVFAKFRQLPRIPAALLPLLVISLLASVLFLFGSGPKAEWRLLGACLLLLAAASGFVLESLLNLKLTAQIRVRILILLVILLVPFQFSFWERMSKEPAELIRQWPGGAAMAWVRMNAKPEDKVATLQETRIYYLFPKFPLRVFDQPRLDEALAKSENLTEMTETLKQAGIRYLILSAEFLDRYYNRRICDAFYQWSEQNPQIVVFRSEYSRVLDLDRIP